MKTRYEKLEGKEVVCRFKDGEEVKGIVSGCDPDIGVSVEILGWYDKSDRYLICLNGRTSPAWIEMYDDFYEDLFECIVEKLETGFCEAEFCDKFSPFYYMKTKSNIQPCPFSQ